MSSETSLMGLNLSVDNELLASAAREAIVASVAESLQMKDQLVHEFVKSMLTEKVRVEDGQPKRYSSDETCSRMEYYIRSALQEATREEIIKMLDEQRPLLREQIRNELAKTETRSKFVNMFIDSLTGTLENKYKAKVDVRFEKDQSLF